MCVYIYFTILNYIYVEREMGERETEIGREKKSETVPMCKFKYKHTQIAFNL